MDEVAVDQMLMIRRERKSCVSAIQVKEARVTVAAKTTHSYKRHDECTISHWRTSTNIGHYHTYRDHF
jgi:hypothetical protein